ncbi:DUF4190 domain-containing protein [Streptomyces sp. NBC_00343]|uniref:DUF4190 domain-containing protein n=1 Tax=Streptomyces sp. NBC_00343 TaxID=2975719 RepID=UPI002E2B9846|nr:DUF4190 domain-containing protein [Streptomyces sp. NBC_00343]
MGDQTQPDAGAGAAGAGANRDPWAAPESGPSLEKGAQPPAPAHQPHPQDQPPPQSPFVHDQATVTAMPAEGFTPPGSATAPAPGAAPGYGPPGTPPGLPTYGAPGYGQPTTPGGYAQPGPPNGPGPGTPGGPGMPGGYGYPGYPQGYGWPGMPMAPQNNMGTTAMVLGILSCCLFCFYGVVSLGLGITAIILGVKGKKRADRGEATNRGQAQAGFITGIIGTVLGVITVAVLIVTIVFAINHGDSTDTSDTDPFYNSAPSVTAPALPQV